MAAPQKLTDAQCVEALRLLAQHGTGTAAARACGMSRRTFTDRIAEAKNRGLDVGVPALDKTAKLELEVSTLRAALKATTAEADSAERIRAEIWGLAKRPPDPPAWLSSPKGKSDSRGMPITLWSDWHWGEVVRPEEVGGFNEFNAEIAAERVRTLVDKTIDLCLNHMGNAKTNYPGIVVCLGGDMITGDIHEELTATNDRTPQQSINDLTDILGSSLERLADVFGRVFVPCVVGNHGRSTRKPRMKGRVYTSLEWTIYCNLERYFRKDKRVTLFIPNESDAHFSVYGHRFLLTHGDSLGVKGGDGIIGAVGPILRGTMKVGRSEAAIGRDFDTIIMGHWHQMLWLPGAIVNGALKGYDEYARLAIRAPYSPPSQALWFCHPTWGITARWEILLEKHRSAPKDAKLLTWNEVPS
jgi:hypothetical protein